RPRPRGPGRGRARRAEPRPRDGPEGDGGAAGAHPPAPRPGGVAGGGGGARDAHEGAGAGDRPRGGGAGLRGREGARADGGEEIDQEGDRRDRVRAARPRRAPRAEDRDRRRLHLSPRKRGVDGRSGLQTSASLTHMRRGRWWRAGLYRANALARRVIYRSRLATRLLYGIRADPYRSISFWELGTLAMRRALGRELREGMRALEVGTGPYAVLALWALSR